MSALLVSLVLGVYPSPHPDSISHAELEIRGDAAELVLRFQSLSAIEVIHGLDADGDARLSPEELEAGEQRLIDYILERWRLLTPEDGPLAKLVEADVSAIDSPFEGPFSFQWMQLTARFVAAAPIEAFTLESRLFHEENPFHSDYVRVVFEDEPELRIVFRADQARYDFAPGRMRRPGVLATFFGLGWRHILEGYDHLAFLLALLVAAPRFRTLAVVVTAFTVAHSLTLAGAALDPGGLLDRIPDHVVELAIALSIAYVACENLMRKGTRTTWIEAFAFGLLHGLGFAGFLGDALGNEPELVTALLGFNLGVEAGQLTFVLVVALVLRVLRGRVRAPGPGEEPSGLVPGWFRMSSSAVVAVLAFYWFGNRAGWLP